MKQADAPNSQGQVWLKPRPWTMEEKVDFLVDEEARMSRMFPTREEVSRMHWALHDAFLETDEPSQRNICWNTVKQKTNTEIDDDFEKTRDRIAVKAKALFRPLSASKSHALWNKGSWTRDEAVSIACGWLPNVEQQMWSEKYSDEIVPARIFLFYGQVIDTAIDNGAVRVPVDPFQFQVWWNAWLQKRPEFLQSNIRPSSVEKILPVLWVLAQNAVGTDVLAQDKKKRLRTILAREGAFPDPKSFDAWLKRGKAFHEAKTNSPEVDLDDV